MWKKRCYSVDIPDEVPTKVMRALKAPSYKAIVIAILKNDYAMKDLGFDCIETKLSLEIINRNKKEINKKDNQLYLFEGII